MQEILYKDSLMGITVSMEQEVLQWVRLVCFKIAGKFQCVMMGQIGEGHSFTESVFLKLCKTGVTILTKVPSWS